MNFIDIHWITIFQVASAIAHLTMQELAMMKTIVKVVSIREKDALEFGASCLENGNMATAADLYTRIADIKPSLAE